MSLAGIGMLLFGPVRAPVRVALPPTGTTHATTTPAMAPYAPVLRGHVVQFALHGFEPDFDPIYGIVLVLTLHDTRHAPLALPDARLILDLYLEQFQPDTTPMLPDLLHPNQQATNLAGFLQGQAVLLNQGGHSAYQGDALAEVFTNSQVHLVLLNMQPPGAAANAPALRLQGSITLYKGGTQTGRLTAMTSPPRAALAVARRRMPAWQAVVGGLRVALPPMRGTGGSGVPRGTVTPSSAAVRSVATAVARARQDTSPRHEGVATVALIVVGAGVVLLLFGLALLWRRGSSRARA